MTGYGAWNRLFDETIARLRFRVGSGSANWSVSGGADCSRR